VRAKAVVVCGALTAVTSPANALVLAAHPEWPFGPPALFGAVTAPARSAP
jgi:hypothetical protein